MLFSPSSSPSLRLPLLQTSQSQLLPSLPQQSNYSLPQPLPPSNISNNQNIKDILSSSQIIEMLTKKSPTVQFVKPRHTSLHHSNQNNQPQPQVMPSLTPASISNPTNSNRSVNYHILARRYNRKILSPEEIVATSLKPISSSRIAHTFQPTLLQKKQLKESTPSQNKDPMQTSTAFLRTRNQFCSPAHASTSTPIIPQQQQSQLTTKQTLLVSPRFSKRGAPAFDELLATQATISNNSFVMLPPAILQSSSSSSQNKFPIRYVRIPIQKEGEYLQEQSKIPTTESVLSKQRSYHSLYNASNGIIPKIKLTESKQTTTTTTTTITDSKIELQQQQQQQQHILPLKKQQYQNVSSQLDSILEFNKQHQQQQNQQYHHNQSPKSRQHVHKQPRDNLVSGPVVDCKFNLNTEEHVQPWDQETEEQVSIDEILNQFF